MFRPLVSRVLCPVLAAAALTATAAVPVAAEDGPKAAAYAIHDAGFRVYDAGFGGPDGATVVAVGYSSSMAVFAPGKDRVAPRNHNRDVNAVAVSPDGTRLATCGEDTTVVVWDAVKMEELYTIKKHLKPVEWAAFSPDGKQLVTAAPDDALHIWDVATKEHVAGLVGGGGHRVAWSPDGKNIAVSSDAAVTLWEAEEPRRLLPTAKKHTAHVRGLVFTADSKTLVSVGEDGKAVFWDTRSGKATAELTPSPEVKKTEGLFSVALTPDGKTLALGSSSGKVLLYDLATKALKDTLVPAKDDRFGTGHVTALHFRKDGRALAAVSQSAAVRVWRIGGTDRRID